MGNIEGKGRHCYIEVKEDMALLRERGACLNCGKGVIWIYCGKGEHG